MELKPTRKPGFLPVLDIRKSLQKISAITLVIQVFVIGQMVKVTCGFHFTIFQMFKWVWLGCGDGAGVKKGRQQTQNARRLRFLLFVGMSWIFFFFGSSFCWVPSKCQTAICRLLDRGKFVTFLLSLLPFPHFSLSFCHMCSLSAAVKNSSFSLPIAHSFICSSFLIYSSFCTIGKLAQPNGIYVLRIFLFQNNPWALGKNDHSPIA